MKYGRDDVVMVRWKKADMSAFWECQQVDQQAATPVEKHDHLISTPVLSMGQRILFTHQDTLHVSHYICDILTHLHTYLVSHNPMCTC